MGETRHTPGPWRLNAGNEIEVMSDNRPIARSLCGGTTGVRLPEAEANALLIAAAPELLQALTWAVDHFDGNTICNAEQEKNCIEICRVAVEKATPATASL